MPTRDEYVEIIKSAALQQGKKAVMNILLAQLPKALTTGLLGAIATPFLSFFVGKILELAIRETEIGLFFLYIDLRTSAQGREFEKSARANFEAQKNGSPLQKEKAERALIDSFRKLAKFTN